MKIIGLCGGSGSGKGTVSSIFKEYNIPTVDTDALYRDMTSKDSPCLRALADEFGREIVTENNSLDRNVLASLVFSGENSKKRLSRLNEISHKFILDKTEEVLIEYEQEGFLRAIVDAPLLFESGFDKKCDKIICVVSDRETRINRIVKRDSITLDAAIRRIDSQIADEELISRSDFVIYNNSDIDSLKEQVVQIISLL